MGARATGSAGLLLAGRYRLVEPLPGAGAGWRARDDLGNREVVARELAPAETPAPVRDRAAREAREAARLRHPAIASVIDVVEHDDAPWAVTELVPAASLDQLLRSRGPVPPVEAARIALPVLDALEVADAAGVRHRDLTPVSVLVAADGRVWVAGFGQTPEPEQAAGRAAAVSGSVDFLAPERARGIPGTGLPADLWSLGATLYAAVEGRLPFHRDGALATLTAVVTDEPPPPRRAGPLRAVIDGLLIKDPAHRLGLDRARQMLDTVVRTAPPAPPWIPTHPQAGSPDSGAAGVGTTDGGTAGVRTTGAASTTGGGPGPGSTASATAGPGNAAAGAAPSGPGMVSGPSSVAAGVGGTVSGGGNQRNDDGSGPSSVAAGAGTTGSAGGRQSDSAEAGRSSTEAGAGGTVSAGHQSDGDVSGLGTASERDAAEVAGTPATGGPTGGPDAAGRAGVPSSAAVTDPGGPAGPGAAGGAGAARSGGEDTTSREIRDPDVAAALAAFEAALAPVMPSPRPASEPAREKPAAEPADEPDPDTRTAAAAPPSRPTPQGSLPAVSTSHGDPTPAGPLLVSPTQSGGPNRSGGPTQSRPVQDGPPQTGQSPSGASHTGSSRTGSQTGSGSSQAGSSRVGAPEEGRASGHPMAAGPRQPGPPQGSRSGAGTSPDGPPQGGGSRADASPDGPRPADAASSGTRPGSPTKAGPTKPGPTRPGPPSAPGPATTAGSRAGSPPAGPPKAGPPKAGPPKAGPPKAGPPRPKPLDPGSQQVGRPAGDAGAAGRSRPDPGPPNGAPPVNGHGSHPVPAARPLPGTPPTANGHRANGHLVSPPRATTPTRRPTPPPPRIQDLGGDRASRRRSLLTILAVVAAVLAAVLIPFVIDRARGDDGRAQADPPPAPSTATASPTASPEAAAPPPAGFVLHRDPTGFSIAVPRGWRQVRDGSSVDFRDPSSSRFIRIDQRADPRTEPYDDWVSREPTYKADLPGYDLIRIANVVYRGWPTADWEFTWGAGGSERSHVLIRNVVPNEYHGYALYWSTADTRWTKDLAYFDVFVRTFAPRPGR